MRSIRRSLLGYLLVLLALAGLVALVFTTGARFSSDARWIAGLLVAMVVAQAATSPIGPLRWSVGPSDPVGRGAGPLCGRPRAAPGWR